MITQAKISHFKRFGAEETFDLSGNITLLAGPNKSGKSTVRQAMAAWNLALQHWLSERGSRAGPKRLSLTVDEFTAAPVRELNLLWENRRTAVAHRTSQGKATSEARPIVVTLSGNGSAPSETWQLAVEFMYASPPLDLSNAGSGFHQVLMLLAFFYARPATPLLLDEPDAHLHFVLQREGLNHLRTVAAARQSQLILATHAEALLDQTEPVSIISFYQKPHRLQTREQALQLRDALQRLSSIDLLQADHAGTILYVEDESDARLLKEWANLLQHPARRFFRFPYIYTLGRAADLEETWRHFLALRVAAPQIGGLCLLDRDPAGKTAPAAWPAGLRLARWRRCEIESYLLNASVVKRYMAESYHQAPEAAHQPSLEQAYVDVEFARLGLEQPDCLDEAVPGLQVLQASDLLISILSKTHRQTANCDLYLLARTMRPDEVHPEVIEKLDALADLLPPLTEGGED